jgi:phage terminase small subunit
MSELSPKQLAFCREYCIDRNATQAAIRAGYSERSAHVQGTRALTNVNVKSEIERLTNKHSEKTDITAERVLTELFRLASVDPRGAFDETGGLLPIKDMPEDVRRAISGINFDDMGNIKSIKFWDKNSSLDKLGKHLKLFTDRIELDASDALADRLAQAMKRASDVQEK